MQVAAVCGVVALGGAAVGLGGACRCGHSVRVRRSAEATAIAFRAGEITIMTALAISIGVISVGTLLLWYLPVLFGYHSPYDGLFFVAWLVLVAFLVVFWFLKKNSSERLQHGLS